MAAVNRNKVTVTLPSDLEICFTRLVDWPRELVFEAWTNAEHLRQWWGCANSQISSCEVDARPGGRWQIIMNMPDGSRHPFKGVYREVTPPARLVYTECYDRPEFGSPEWLTTITFEDLGKRTQVTQLLRHASIEARNGHLQSGMEPGITHAFDRIDDLLAAIHTFEGAHA